MRLSIIAGLICLALAGVLTACGGDDSSSTTPSTSAVASGDYFHQLQAYFDDSRERTNDATTTLDDNLATATTLDEEKAAINQFLDTMTATFNNAVTTMDNIDPPDDAQAAHDRFRNDISQANDVIDDLRGELADASTQEAAQAVVDDFNNRVNGLVDDAEAACRDLQTSGDTHGANVDLQCNPSSS